MKADVQTYMGINKCVLWGEVVCMCTEVLIFGRCIPTKKNELRLPRHKIFQDFKMHPILCGHSPGLAGPDSHPMHTTTGVMVIEQLQWAKSLINLLLMTLAIYNFTVL